MHDLIFGYPDYYGKKKQKVLYGHAKRAKKMSKLIKDS